MDRLHASDSAASSPTLRIAHSIALSLIAIANAAMLALVIVDLVVAPREEPTPMHPAVESPLKNRAWHKPGVEA